MTPTITKREGDLLEMLILLETAARRYAQGFDSSPFYLLKLAAKARILIEK